MPRELTGPEHGPQEEKTPDSLVLLLHGWGADGNDLIGLAPHFAGILPGTVFLAPNGPEPCDAGFGLQWFGLEDRTPAVMRAGADVAAEDINAYLDTQLKRFDLKPGRVAILGFSQGTMMALHVALRRDSPVAGVLGFSGMLLDGEALEDEIRSRPPVVLIHGEDDPVVSHAAMPHAAEALRDAKVPVETHSRPGLGHGIDPEGVALGAEFLTRILG